MAKSLSKSLLAPSVFKTKPNDKLATLDVYSKNNTEIVNKIQDIAKMFDVDVTNIMKGGAIISKNFPIVNKALGQVNDVLKVNTDNLVARISSISKNVSSYVGQLGDNFSKTISNLPIAQEVYTVVDGVRSRVGEVDFSALKPIVNTIQEITSDTGLMQLIDLDAETALYVGLISEATNNGISDGFGAVVEVLDNPIVRNNVIKNVLPFAINSSDVRMLESIINSDLSKSSILDGIGLISDFSRRYRSGYGYSRNESHIEFDTLYRTYRKIHPEWNLKTVLVNGSEETILDISKITDSSEDFKSSLLNYFKIKDEVDEDDLFLTLATEYGKTTVEEELKKMLPMLVLHEAFNQF